MECNITIKNYRCFSEAQPATLGLRNGLTALIGQNNSGKSSLLRFFFELRPYFQHAGNQYRQLLGGGRVSVNTQGEVPEHAELFSFTNLNDISVTIEPINHPLSDHPPTISIERESTVMTASLRGVPKRNPAADHANIWLSGNQVINPTRFREVFDCLAKTMYIGAFRNALNRGGQQQNYFDLPLGQSFISAWEQWQAGNFRRHNYAAARVVEHIREIFGFRTLTVTAAPENQRLVFTINERPLRDHEVGSGLTQILMTLATAAIGNPSYILIDEPELNLHPSLQTKFLMALASYAQEGVLFGTHSVGLARTVADNIFSVQQPKEGHSEIKKFEDTTNLAELLGEMSFSAFREMGFEKILLVEGRTEVKAVQQFLRTLKKDHKVVSVPLGGKSMICGQAEHELTELRRLCDHTFALIDSEKATPDAPLEQSRLDFIAACQRTGITCKVLDRRATENYFPASAIKRAFPSHSYAELAPYAKLGDQQPNWSKTDNWRIAAEMTKDELLATDLGQFLDKI